MVCVLFCLIWQCIEAGTGPILRLRFPLFAPRTHFADLDLRAVNCYITLTISYITA